jgi:hypothetical protein
MASELNTTARGNSWLLGGVSVALISAISYSLAFTYEAGFALYFGIPLSLIRVDLTTIFIAFGGIILIAWFLFLVADRMFIIIGQQKGIVRNKLFFLFPFILVFIFLLVRYGNFKEAFYASPLLILFLIIGIMQFITALVPTKDKKSYIERLELQAKNAKPEPDLIRTFIKFPNGIVFIFAIVLIFLVFYHTGRSEAYRQEKFLVFNDSQAIVLRIYSDRVVCSSFDEKEKTIGNRLLIFDNATVAKLQFEWKKVGPLKLTEAQK